MVYSQGHDPNRTTAIELVMSNLEDMEAAFYDVKYGELHWRDVIPEASVDMNINPGANVASYRVQDIRGKGGFRSQFDNGIPQVGRTLDKNLVPVEVAGVGATFDREDARQVMFGLDTNLLTDLSEIMRKACDRHVEGTIFYGDDAVQGFEGWLDYSLVPVANVPNGGGGNPEWSTKTSDEIVDDINNSISTVWNNSKEVHLPDTIYLPGEQLALIASKRMSDASDMTVLEYVKKNNIYTSLTGNELTIKNIRYLDQAGAGGTDRMVTAETKPENYKLPFPLPFDLLDPQERGFSVELFAEYKFGSVHLRYPRAMLYSDGI